MGIRQVNEQEFKCDRPNCSAVERFESLGSADESEWRIWKTFIPSQAKFDDFVFCPTHTKEMWGLTKEPAHG